MALKENIQLWNEAVILYERGDLSECLVKLSLVQVSAKICYNQGVVCWQLNRTQDAIKYFDQALQLDSFLAVAYFQRGLLQFSLHRLDEADRDLQSAWSYLRGSIVIDYKQLGLPAKLHAAQVLYNRAVVKNCMKDGVSTQNLLSQLHRCPKDDNILKDVDVTKLEKVLPLNPSYGIFRPPKGKVSNLTKHDFLGKSEVVSSVHHIDYDQRKSSSTPSSPSSIRKNALTIATDRRMAVTPPPTRPPPKVKAHELIRNRELVTIAQRDRNNSNVGSGVATNMSMPGTPPPKRPPPRVKVDDCNPSDGTSMTRAPLRPVLIPQQISPKRPAPILIQNTLPTSINCVTKGPVVPPPSRPPNIHLTSLSGEKKEKPHRPPPPVFKS